MLHQCGSKELKVKRRPSDRQVKGGGKGIDFGIRLGGKSCFKTVERVDLNHQMARDGLE